MSSVFGMGRGREEILLLLLDQAKIVPLKSGCHPSQGEIAKVVNPVLTEKKLWTVVFQATGKLGRLHKHSTYLNAKQVVDNLSKSIIDGQIPLNYLRSQRDQEDIAELLTLGRCCPPGKEVDPLLSVENQWVEVLASLSREREELRKSFIYLEKAIHLANEITGDGSVVILQDFNTINNAYNDRKSTLTKTKFADIRKENYWGLLECLLKPSMELSELCDSILFKNFSGKLLEEHVVNKRQFKEVLEDVTEDQEEKNGQDAMTVEDVLVLLNNDGAKSFIGVFKRITDQVDQVTTKELDRLLTGVQEHNINEEVKSVCKILKIKSPSLSVLKMLRNFVKFEDVRKRIQTVVDCLVTVGYVAKHEDSGDFLQTLQSFLSCKETGTLKSISTRMDEQVIVEIKHLLSPDMVDILAELSQASELIAFSIETAKENMVHLIEAVEEHSEQLIQESTVSYLIDVHRFLSVLLTNKPDNPKEFLKEITRAHANLMKDRLPGSNIEDESGQRETKMAAKIKVCSSNVHTLRRMYETSSSDRGELTKGIIKSAVTYGRYIVRIEENGSIDVQLLYTRQDQTEAKYNFDELNDLRSRALLIVNADKTYRQKVVDGKMSVISQEELKSFIDGVDLLTEIVRKYKILKTSGIPKYLSTFWKHLNSINEIREEARRVENEVEEWNTMIHNVRHQHFFLDFFHTKQIWILKSFFIDKEFSDEVLALFRCIDSNVIRDDLPYFQSKYEKPKMMTKTEDDLNAIGSALDSIFRSSHEEPLPDIVSTIKIDAVVEPGKLYVGVLEPGSAQTVHVVMALFQNTCACLPKPSQLLFCHSRTTWEEIELLLLRTFEAHGHGITSKLHCIANVESLPNDVQFKLVESLKNLTTEVHAPYLLAVVCRGGSHHHIADQFSDYVHFYGGTPDADLREQFKQTCPETFLVTGDLPGLGKSEEIYSHASEKGRAVVTFPISGPFVRRDLVKRLSDLNLKHFQSIHFDIGDVDDPAGLDTFLFELVVTKMVSSEALLFSLPTDHVYIEIANTLQQGIRNSLPICKCFKRLDVFWHEYRNLLSSIELTSPIQVVCQYLHAYDCGTLENEEIIFSGSNKVKSLKSSECKALLVKYFFPGGDLSFNILENFISVLADQLMKFTRSPYCKPQHIKAMVGEEHDVRIRLFKALCDVATSFAARSVNTCKATQTTAVLEVQAIEALKKMRSGGAMTAEQMVDRVKEMTPWTDHLVIMLHGAGAITAIYRDLKNVPQQVKDLFQSQAMHGEGLEDYTTMSQEELQDRLERISNAPQNQDKVKLASLDYALTPDNILKMALIIQRMQANIPVIIMGETGCGKTSLVRYLAHTCAIPFEVFSFHAGITEKQIFHFISSKDEEARNFQKEGKSMWIFLDEINTCDYLGTINEIVCHRSIHGKPLASNLVFVAACNPYRLRPPGRIMTAGLTGKTTLDEFSKLVYRVHPLPETMIDYVWDYGSLNAEDEKAYIRRMVERNFDGTSGEMLVDLLATSQAFIRSEDQSCFCDQSLQLLKGSRKCFEKAKKYKSEDVLPVVLLDEIGLAEISKFNPLKVLHRLLEPGEGKLPDVAVVGISNWALDAAKMNRAIHLSRPEPDEDDLYDTGLSIRHAQISTSGGYLTRSTKFQIKCLAEAYYEYQSKQKHDNFHGLRDYYSMVKCLDISRNSQENNEKIQRAMQRNFGGISTGKRELETAFLQKLKVHQPVGDVMEFPVTELIRDNLKDEMARHLMIITSGDSAIGILDQTLKDLNKEKITIFGSRFEEDRSADYNHRILSRIILCMERNCILILRDLESIYGSLYDMLNQNYIVVGGKKNCRVALGAFSNPMCQVDDGFRCIVLVDEDRVDYADPPFLNRFEKQLLRFSDVLNANQRQMIKDLSEWTESISTIEGHETEFNEFDMFAGFHDDTLPSIVLFHSQDSETPMDDVIARCKKDLMSVAMPDAVIRSRNSMLCRVNDEEVNELYDDYFKLPIHDGLKAFLRQSFEAYDEEGNESNDMKILVMTHSSIHTDVSKCVEDLIHVQVEKLSFFKSEKELSKRINHFWMESDASLLVVQCRPETDAPQMLLVKTIIEEHRKSFINSLSHETSQKHVCIVIHLRRSVQTDDEVYHQLWQFNFLSGWEQVMIDALEKPSIQIKEMLEYTVIDVLQSKSVPFRKVAADQLLWCFTRIKYPPLKTPHLGDISSLVATITSSAEIMNSFMKLCCRWIENELDVSKSAFYRWHIAVACNRQNLINSSTLVKAMEYYITHLVRRPLARIIYFLQKHSAWKVLTDGSVEARQECLHLMSSESVLDLHDIPEPQDAESLVVYVSHLDLHFPFSYLFCKRVDNLYDFFSEEYRRQCLENENLDENEELNKDARKVLTRKVTMKVEQAIMEIVDSHVLSKQLRNYVDDFLDIKTEDVSQALSRRQRINIMKAHYGDQMPTISESEHNDVAYIVAQLHINVWLEGNAIPQVFYFVQTCMPTSTLSIDELVSRYLDTKGNAVEELRYANETARQGQDNEAREQDYRIAHPQENEEPCLVLPFSIEESPPGSSEEKGESFANVMKRKHSAEEEMIVEDIEDEQDESDYPSESDQDKDDAEEDSKATEKPEPTFEEFLVKEVCLSLLPTDDLVQSAGGFEEWKNVTSLVLSSAIKYCLSVPAFHYLKVCSDLASLVLPGKTPYSIFGLGERGKLVNDDNYLDSKEIFETVRMSVQNEGVDNNKKRDEFLFLFYERCIESNPDSPLMGEILRIISSEEEQHMLQLASSILHQILLTEHEEMAFSLENFGNLITSTDLNDFPNLMEINDALSQLEDSDIKELDCHINVICCDLINKLAFKDLNIKEVSSSDDPAVINFHKAMDVITKCDEECKNNMFGFICAVSYLRAFISELSRLLSKSGSTSSLDLILNDVCKRLEDGKTPTRKTSVSTFLLKELGQELCLYDVKQLIQSCEKLHLLRSLGWDDSDCTSKLGYDPFHRLANKSEAETALGLHVAGTDSTRLEKFLESMGSSKKRMEFAAVIVEQFYIVRSIRKLKDIEDKAAQFVTEKLANAPDPFNSFITRLAGQESFECAELEISPESKAIDVEVAVLIQHITAIVTSRCTGKSKNPVACCLVNPTVLKESYVLASPENDSGYSMCEHYKTAIHSKVALFSCKCGTRFASETTSGTKCPNCHSPCEKDTQREEKKAPCNSKGYVKCSPASLKNEMLHVRSLDPIEFRILHVIVHSAFLAGYSLGLSANALLVDVMKNDRPSDTIYQIIQIDLGVLSTLLCCKKDKIITLLHHVFEEVSSFLTEDSGLPLPHDEKARSSWETYFAKQVQPVIKKFRENGFRDVQMGQNDKVPLETVIEEPLIGNCTALQFLFRKDAVCSFPIVHVQDAKEKEIIRYEWTDDFLELSQYATEYGQGKTITYDMTRIEKEMAGSFLLGKAYLNTMGVVREFVFSKQLFHDCANILNELCQAIPQEKLPNSVEAELGSSATKSMDRIQILLQHMELVLCYLKRTGGKTEQSLVDYIDTWIPSSRPFPKDLLPSTLKTIQVKHVCALYEFVEDQLALPSVDCVGQEYRKTMLDGTEEQMTEISKDESKSVLEAIVGAIKRFVFRYLHMKPHPDECLVEFMKDPSLWPMAIRSQRGDNAFKVSEAAPKFFLRELTIGNVYEVHGFYQDQLQKYIEIKTVEEVLQHHVPTVIQTQCTERQIKMTPYLLLVMFLHLQYIEIKTVEEYIEIKTVEEVLQHHVPTVIQTQCTERQIKMTPYLLLVMFLHLQYIEIKTVEEYIEIKTVEEVLQHHVPTVIQTQCTERQIKMTPYLLLVMFLHLQYIEIKTVEEYIEIKTVEEVLQHHVPTVIQTQCTERQIKMTPYLLLVMFLHLQYIEIKTVEEYIEIKTVEEVLQHHVPTVIQTQCTERQIKMTPYLLLVMFLHLQYIEIKTVEEYIEIKTVEEYIEIKTVEEVLQHHVPTVIQTQCTERQIKMTPYLLLVMFLHLQYIEIKTVEEYIEIKTVEEVLQHHVPTVIQTQCTERQIKMTPYLLLVMFLHLQYIEIKTVEEYIEIKTVEEYIEIKTVEEVLQHHVPTVIQTQCTERQIKMTPYLLLVMFLHLQYIEIKTVEEYIEIKTVEEVLQHHVPTVIQTQCTERQIKMTPYLLLVMFLHLQYIEIKTVEEVLQHQYIEIKTVEEYIEIKTVEEYIEIKTVEEVLQHHVPTVIQTQCTERQIKMTPYLLLVMFLHLQYIEIKTVEEYIEIKTVEEYMKIKKVEEVLQHQYMKIKKVEEVLQHQKESVVEAFQVLEELSNVDALKRGREEILLLLLDQAKIVPLKSGSHPSQGEIAKVVNPVLTEKKLWTVIFQATGKVGRLHKHPIYLTVKQVVDNLSKSIIDGQIPFNYLRNQRDQKDIAELLTLGRCCPPGKEVDPLLSVEKQWVEVLASLSREREEMRKSFIYLKKAIHLVNEITGDGGVVILQDFNTINNAYNGRKTTLTKTKFADIRKENYWGLLECLLKPSMELSELCDSILFKNFSGKLLEEHVVNKPQAKEALEDVTEDQEEKNGQDAMTVEDVLVLLNNDGAKSFIGVFKRITDQVDQVTTKELDRLLTGVQEHNIDEEVKSVLLADQLMKFTRSPYCNPQHIKAMVGEEHDVRIRLFKALCDVATSFAARSVNTCKATQTTAMREVQAIEALKRDEIRRSNDCRTNGGQSKGNDTVD
ncbi:hypothetical protein QZH41_001215 [Actinostola sp. cb2023]|nr:hypothetical protein QZH41_001215 [Actinostola sp. cb2023]